MTQSAAPDSTTAVREAADALGRAPIFALLGEDDRMQLASGAAVRRYARGATVWQQGDPGDSVVLVLGGRLKAWIGSRGARGWLRDVVRRGDVWGMTAAIDGGKRVCTLAALESSRIIHIDARELGAMLERRPECALYVARLLSAELRAMVGRCEQLALHTPLERLAGYLLENADSAGRVHLRETQGQIAAQIGTVREVVGRSFRRLERDGLVARRGRDVQVLERKTLQNLAR